ncbi:MAG: hypothetical protein F4017_00930 [Acidimicrobiaceae bacterium]|nr:hypothetical protein [Gemmatimonadota bacterium]MYE75628.1 hypothetical protein [Acidimicrobiaceae bacterium]MYH44843.1 hypothetical protein [Acidimicrobiaceae bacterium]MYJ09895.1 hypothetical protein [Gemmatimonadota bacterium]MYK73147.1 hypothetical protein [Acidimicrobiaceae bacterium]
MISAGTRAIFERDRVVKIPGAVDGGWVERILEDAQMQLGNPGPWVTDTNPGASQDRLFTTRYRWQHAPVIRDFVFSSPVAAMAASLSWGGWQRDLVRRNLLPARAAIRVGS